MITHDHRRRPRDEDDHLPRHIKSLVVLDAIVSSLAGFAAPAAARADPPQCSGGTVVTPRTAPKPTAKAVSASIAKGISLRLAGNEAGTAKLTLSVGTAKIVKGSVKVTVELTAKARKTLKRVHKLGAKLTIVATDAAHNSTTTTRTVLLQK
jgi:hypothetical protein